MSYWFHPGAEHEHLEIIGFYETRQAGLGAAYLAEFENLMTRVIGMLGIYRIDREPDIRVVSLIKFLYRIIFRENAVGVQILAISHKKRRPDYWLGRL